MLQISFETKKLYKKIKTQIITYFNELLAQKYVNKLKDGTYQLKPTPIYISQLADAKNENIEKYYGKINDLKAQKKFGAKNNKDFNYWAWRACGIADLQMILKTELKSKFDKNTMQLINEGLKLNGYDIKNDIGWYHKALVSLGEKYGVNGQLVNFISINQIAKFVLENKYILASLKSSSGGHLVLIYGFTIKNNKVINLIIHDPYTYNNIGKSNTLNKKDFVKKSKKRGIVFNKI